MTSSTARLNYIKNVFVTHIILMNEMEHILLLFAANGFKYRAIIQLIRIVNANHLNFIYKRKSKVCTTTTSTVNLLTIQSAFKKVWIEYIDYFSESERNRCEP